MLRLEEYIAPYELHHRLIPPTGRYVIHFHEGYTIEEHFEFLGRSVPGVWSQHLMYRALLTDKEREDVRRDPGVRKIEQATKRHQEEATQANRSVVIIPGKPESAGPPVHTVFFDPESTTFTRNPYTIEEHLWRYRLVFEVLPVPGIGYSATLTDVQIQAVFRDSRVHSIWRNLYTNYVAPFYDLPLGTKHRGEYLVRFHTGYTIEQHFGHLGGPQPFRVQDQEYQAPLKLHDLEHIRRDPGVKYIQLLTNQMSWQAQAVNRSVIFTPAHLDEAPGYRVLFARPGCTYQQFYEDCDTDENCPYTAEEHRDAIGLDMKVDTDPCFPSYTAELTEEQIKAVFSDPWVHTITKAYHSRFCA